MNDRRHVLTKDTEQNVAMWDVLTASKVQDLGPVDFEGEVKRRFKMVYVPHWFSVDLKIGASYRDLVSFIFYYFVSLSVIP